ncbi:Uncharacterised protein [Mycobacteroides abscessus subsp. abscessus]|nr:Uncharacterised protein [Mycobacteroides abscessus subsp. abscessus]
MPAFIRKLNFGSGGHGRANGNPDIMFGNEWGNQVAFCAMLDGQVKAEFPFKP